MKVKSCFLQVVVFSLVCWGLVLFQPSVGSTHCDTLAGPVVQDGRLALQSGDVTPVLKWVGPNQEKKVRAAFQKALAAKSGPPAVKEKAEMEFFGTLVRIHRAGEGAPYTGLKPMEAVEPIVAAADKALETGSADDLIKQVNEAATAGIRRRFELAAEKKKHAGESVAAGREYVAAYVDFTHYVEGLHRQAAGEGSHHQGETKKHKHEKERHEKEGPAHKH
jgi:hypothetical protein